MKRSSLHLQRPCRLRCPYREEYYDVVVVRDNIPRFFPGTIIVLEMDGSFNSDIASYVGPIQTGFLMTFRKSYGGTGIVFPVKKKNTTGAKKTGILRIPAGITNLALLLVIVTFSHYWLSSPIVNAISPSICPRCLLIVVSSHFCICCIVVAAVSSFDCGEAYERGSNRHHCHCLVSLLPDRCR